jgi:hypothetical protein
MRKSLCAILLIAAIAGCTSHKAGDASSTTSTTGTASGPGGNQTESVQTHGGSLYLGKNAVNPATMGLPVYPGATANVNGALSGMSAQGSSQLISLKTSDSFEKVFAWYKSRMPENPQNTRSASGKISIGEFFEGTSADKQWKSVTLTSLPAGTTITLRSMSRK